MPNTNNVTQSPKPSTSSFFEFFQESEGGYSATRLILLTWSFGTLIMWILMSIHKDHLQPIDPAVATILGILMGGKTLQRFAENGPAVLPPISGAPSPPVPKESPRPTPPATGT